MKQPVSILLIFTAAIMAACSATQSTRVVSSSDAHQTQYTDLGEYLRGVAGLTVSNNGGTYQVRIRGTVGTGDVEPLFVVGRVQVGGYDQAAAIVDPNDIDRVQVLKDVSSTQAYGMRGANGVIIIKMKE